MKRLIFVLFVTLTVACKNGNAPVLGTTTGTQHSLNFNWLLGNWQRVNEQEGKETFENWTRSSDLEYHGFGFTLQNSDTIWQENLKLVKANDGWSLEITGKGETIPTVFKLTETNKNSFVSENPENEFPKTIRYFKNGNNISAVISGGGMNIPFEFKSLDSNKK